MKIESANPLFEFYEKLYFHEIDMREKLSARIQVPLAVFISLVGALAFMLQNYEDTVHNQASYFFILFLAASSLALLVSLYFFIRSWYGHTYSFLPTAQKTESYREELCKTYNEYEDGKTIAENHLDEYLCNYMITCSSINTEVNDARAWYFHKLSGWLIIVALLLLISFLFFHFGHLDKGHQTKTLQMRIINPIDPSGNLIYNENYSKIFEYMPIYSPSNLKKNIEPPKVQQEKKRER
jgi:hypothetical protein